MAEFNALRSVHREELLRWATERAQYSNVNFLRRDKEGKPTDAPWYPEDFLGEGNRAERQVIVERERFMVGIANVALEKIVKGKPADDDIPGWAKG